MRRWGGRKEKLEVSSDSTFWEFSQKGVNGVPCAPRRTPGDGVDWGTKYGESRRCKTTKEAVEDRGQQAVWNGKVISP